MGPLLPLALELPVGLVPQRLRRGAVASGSAWASFSTRAAASPASVRASMAQAVRPTAPPRVPLSHGVFSQGTCPASAKRAARRMLLSAASAATSSTLACLARQAAFLLCAVLSAAAAAGTELIWPFFVIGGAAVLLPLTEAITGAAYPFFFLASLLYFLLRSIHICLIRRRELYTCISSISVKEAIDTLHTGLLFFRRSGDILLCNRRMDALARQLTGQPLRSGLEFQRYLENGELQDGCIREALGDQQVFRLPDASVWSIAAHAIPMGRRTCVLLTADDVTERWDAVTLLARQNEALEQRGRELRHTIEHLQAICEAEEIARSKGRVHDLLGQRISLLLRTLRDGQQPDETLLTDFWPAVFPQPCGRTIRPLPPAAWRCCGRPFRAWMCWWRSGERCRRTRRWQVPLRKSPWSASPMPCATAMPPTSSSTCSTMTAGA